MCVCYNMLEDYQSYKYVHIYFTETVFILERVHCIVSISIQLFQLLCFCVCVCVCLCVCVCTCVCVCVCVCVCCVCVEVILTNAFQ